MDADLSGVNWSVSFRNDRVEGADSVTSLLVGAWEDGPGLVLRCREAILSGAKWLVNVRRDRVDAEGPDPSLLLIAV